MDYTIIILGVVVVILLYILYKYLLSPATSLASQAYLNNGTPASLTMPASSTALNYSYNVWVCVNSWNSNNLKTIFYRYGSPAVRTDPLNNKSSVTSEFNGTSTDPQIILYLDSTTPTLYCYIGQTGTSNCQVIPPIPLTTNFPLQKWVYVSVSVQGQYVDLYLQGKLVKSIQLSCMASSPGDSTVPTYLGARVDANVAGFQYYPNALTPQQVWSNYMAGNGQSSLSSLNSYGINVDITSNGTTQNTYTLF